MWGADCWGPHIGAAHPQCTGVEGTVDTGVEGDSGGGAHPCGGGIGRTLLATSPLPLEASLPPLVPTAMPSRGLYQGAVSQIPTPQQLGFERDILLREKTSLQIGKV